MTDQAPAQFRVERPPYEATTPEQALWHRQHATTFRTLAKSRTESGDQTGARAALRDADEMEASVESYLDAGSHVTGPIQVGNGGEMVVATGEDMAHIPGVIDTVRKRPDMLAAAASGDRLELTGRALTLAADAAESIQPRNSLEKMLAHQLAASHRLGMTFIDKATTLLHRFDLAISGLRPVSDAQVNSIEAARLANAASRMMASYHDGLLVLDRIRRGGNQTVKVVHVHQQVAVVAGAMKAGGPKQRKRTGGVRKNGA